MSAGKIFYAACLAFIVGLGTYQFFKIPILMIGIFVCGGILLVVLAWPSGNKQWTNKRKIFLAAGFVLAFFFLGAGRICFWEEGSGSCLLQINSQEKIEIFGWVEQEKTKTERSHQFVFIAEKIKLAEQETSLNEKVLLILPAYADFRPGDQLRVRGKIQGVDTEEEVGLFYQQYLGKDKIFTLMVYPETTKIGWKNQKPVVFFLYKIKDKFSENLRRILPEPQLSFLAGLLLGEKAGLSKQTKENFSQTGTSHLVALSGFNITIIVQALAGAFLFLRINRRRIFWLCLLVIVAFVMMVGAGSSIVRAAVMGLLFLLAQKEGRLYGAARAILLAGLVMLWFRPQDLIFDIGFQLSFLATLGLVYLTPVFSRWFRVVPAFLGFKEALISTLAAQVFVLPLLIFYFQKTSLVSPLVNVLILPAVPLTMLFGFLAGAFSFLWIGLGKLLGWLSWIFLTYELGVIGFFARWPLAALEINLPTIGFILFSYYAFLAFFVWWWRRREQERFVRERNEILVRLK